MIPTEEQKEIINCNLNLGESLTVEAGAGTGKTSCFIEFSKTHPKEKILYICFNNKGVAEAREKYRKEGVRNTTTSTIHGLAREKKEFFEKLGKFRTKITGKEIQTKLRCTHEEAWNVQVALKNFCESEDKKPERKHLHTDLKRSQEEEEKIVRLAEIIWEAMINPKDPFAISYDQYLKVYQLDSPKLHYDYILLDEGQDSNKVSLNIIEKQRKNSRIIIIGDECQAIYSWRGAHNAMASWKADYTKPLTESFRFGKEIAKMANIILSTFQKRGKIKGRKKEDSIGTLHSQQPFTLIARSNATLFETAIHYKQIGKKFHFISTKENDNWNPTLPYKFDDAKDVYRLYIGDRDGIKNPHIKIFESYQELRKMAEGIKTLSGEQVHGDKELEALCKLVEKYSHKLPDILHELVINSCSPEEADVSLVTAHRAKGLEFEYVKMANDFAPLIIKKTDKDTEDTPPIRLASPITKTNPQGDTTLEELNLIYVAITRASKRLEVNDKIRELLAERELLPHIKEFPIETEAQKSTPKIEINTSSPTDINKKEKNRKILRISYELKDEAKTIAKTLGGSLLWAHEEKGWVWNHPTQIEPPKEIIDMSRQKGVNRKISGGLFPELPI